MKLTRKNARPMAVLIVVAVSIAAFLGWREHRRAKRALSSFPLDDIVSLSRADDQIGAQPTRTVTDRALINDFIKAFMLRERVTLHRPRYDKRHLLTATTTQGRTLTLSCFIRHGDNRNLYCNIIADGNRLKGHYRSTPMYGVLQRLLSPKIGATSGGGKK